MKKNFFIASLLGLTVLFVTLFLQLFSSASALIDKTTERSAQKPANTTDRITVSAAGRGNSLINLRDGSEVPTSYVGPASLQETLQQNLAQPLTLASADFDEDGTPDLICGYIGPSGGIVTLHRGNVDALFPNSPEARQRKARGEFTDSPFLPSASVFAVAEAPDFLGDGDFDADGHWDVVAATRKSNALYFLPGNGKGEFGEAKQIQLPGRVTAMVTGEINRRDGLDDVVVSIIGAHGAEVLVYEGAEGVLKAKPETFAIPAEATGLALGQLNDEYAMDLAVAAGRDLLVIHGRDRRLSLDEARRYQVPAASISRRSLPFSITSLALGDFSGNHQTDVALLAEDGTVRLLRNEKAESKKQSSSKGMEKWKSEVVAPGSWPGGAQLVCAHVSVRPADDLLVVGSAGNQLSIITGGKEANNSQVKKNKDEEFHTQVKVDAEVDVVNALPMRLNADALSDFLILRKGGGAPSFVLTAPATTFAVTTTADNGNDASPTPGSLRQAIIAANSNIGLDTINFSIGSGAQTITPPAPLPTITDPVVIDGTTQPGFVGSPLIELNGANAGTSANGLEITAGSSTVRGLVINRFQGNTGIKGNGILLINNGGNLIQGNFIGTDDAGMSVLGNEISGVEIIDTPNNVIGGTVSGARNIISGNSVGINIIRFFSSGTTPGNLIQGNFIGTDVNGAIALGNMTDGVHGQSAINNTIGGTITGARNIISGNGGDGIGIGSGSFGLLNTGNLIQGNFIGTDVNGAVALGNELNGVLLEIANDNTIGGTVAGARNIISDNSNGVEIEGNLTTGNLVQGNFIGTRSDGTSSLGNSTHGVEVQSSASNNTIGGIGVTPGTCDGPCNKIAFSGPAANREGVHIISGVGNAVLGNTIFSNSELGIDLGDDDTITPNDPCDADISANNLQNFPVMALTSPTTIQGTLNSAANTSFRIEFFNNDDCDPSGFGEGQTFLGAITVTTDASCNANFTFTINPGQNITATATNLTTNDTSEFSNCVQAGSATPPVVFSVTPASGNCALPQDLLITGAMFLLPGGSANVTSVFGRAQDNPINVIQATSFAILNSSLISARFDFGSANCGRTFLIFVSGPNGTSPPTDPQVSFTCDSGHPIITCPPNQITNTDPGQCSASVIYPPPNVSNSCGGGTGASSQAAAVTCSPPSGSTFAKGTTTVTCTASDDLGRSSSCSFTVDVLDNIPPTIACTGDVEFPTSAGRCDAVVNYVTPLASDNCPGNLSVTCVPPLGAILPVGATAIRCVARDDENNESLCQFKVLVRDSEPPRFSLCPGPRTVEASGPSCTSTISDLALPAATDNCSDKVTVTATRSDGLPLTAPFLAGNTIITYTAMDASGNLAICQQSITVNSISKVVVPPEIDFGEVDFEIAKKKKPKKRFVSLADSTRTFTITNDGCSDVALTLKSINRTGGDTTNGKITNTDDSDFFSIREIGGGVKLPKGDNTILIPSNPNNPSARKKNFEIIFQPRLPERSTSNRGLSTKQALPDPYRAEMVLMDAAGTTFRIALKSNVSNEVHFINPDDIQKKAPFVSFTRSGDTFTVEYTLYDADTGGRQADSASFVKSARYEFLNNSGNVVQTIDADLAGPIETADLARGQRFKVTKTFSGADDNSSVSRVRVTVTDGVASPSLEANLISGTSAQTFVSAQGFTYGRDVTIYLSGDRLEGFKQ